MVGTELPNALQIMATDSKGKAVSDLTVNFRVTSGGGSVFAGAASTDNKGIAQDYWTLGTSAAEAQTVEVRAVLSNGQRDRLLTGEAEASAACEARTGRGRRPGPVFCGILFDLTKQTISATLLPCSATPSARP